MERNSFDECYFLLASMIEKNTILIGYCIYIYIRYNGMCTNIVYLLHDLMTIFIGLFLPENQAFSKIFSIVLNFHDFFKSL